MKRLKDGADAAAQRRFVREVHILTNLDHPNIVKVIGRRLQDSPFFYVMPIYPGSLREELDAHCARARGV